MTDNPPSTNKDKNNLLPVWITNSVAQLNNSNDNFLSFATSSVTKEEEPSSPVKSNEELNAFVSHAKGLANQLQDLVNQGVDYDLFADGKPLTYEELVSKLSFVLSHQKEVNEATSKMTATNYVVNMVNYVKNRQLKSLVQDGRKQLRQMSSQVIDLENQVVDLNTEVAVQKKTSERFKSGLDSTRVLLESSITEYRQELSRQSDLIRRQQMTVSDLFKSKFNQDFILDSSLFGVSLYLVNTSLVNYPIQMILWLLIRGGNRGSNSKQALFLRQFIKLLCFIYAFTKARTIANYYGLHNQIGSITQYIWTFLPQFQVKRSKEELEKKVVVVTNP